MASLVVRRHHARRTKRYRICDRGPVPFDTECESLLPEAMASLEFARDFRG